jgi:hypothetical protein
LYGYLKHGKLIRNNKYVKGISLGVISGVRSHLYLEYTFFVSGNSYHSAMPNSFCKECGSCCSVGNSIIVRYDRTDPENNSLVVKLPIGAVLENN